VCKYRAGFASYMRARVEPQPDIIGEVDAELEALQRNAQELFPRRSLATRRNFDDLQSVALKSTVPAVADSIAGTLPSLPPWYGRSSSETPTCARRLEALMS